MPALPECLSLLGFGSFGFLGRFGILGRILLPPELARGKIWAGGRLRSLGREGELKEKSFFAKRTHYVF